MDNWSTASADKILPPLTPSEEESEKLARIQGDLDTYVDQMFVKFVMGKEPIENFDAYIATLKKMGMDDAIKIRQAQLERFDKR